MAKMMHIEESQVIDAQSEALNAVLRDYQVGHPAILPKPYFSALTVEKGGEGEGTVLRGSVTAFGTVRAFHQQVTEPKPGRVLVETDVETGQYTTFTFEPLNGGSQTLVTIASDFPVTPGFIGFVEKLTTPAFIHRLYRQELKNLAEYVRSLKSAQRFSYEEKEVYV